MKKTLLVLALFPLFSNAQKIRISEYDKTLRAYRIESTEVQILQPTFVANDAITMGLRSVDTTIFLTVIGIGKTAGVVTSRDKIIFTFNDNSTVEAVSKGVQTYYASSNSYTHEYYISEKDIAALKEKAIKSVQISVKGNYVDIPIIKKFSNSLASLSTVFLNEYNNKKSEIVSLKGK